MPRGGAREGAGRPRGPTKATIARALASLDNVVKEEPPGRRLVAELMNPDRELGKAALERYMKLCEGAAAHFRPVTPAEAAAGKPANPQESWALFGEWVDRAAWCANQLAKYQSPTYRAVFVSMPAAPAPAPLVGGPDNVHTIKDPVRSSRVYAQFMKAAAR